MSDRPRLAAPSDSASKLAIHAVLADRQARGSLAESHSTQPQWSSFVGRTIGSTAARRRRFGAAEPKRNRFESCALELLSFYTNSCYKIERLDFASTRLRNRFPLLPR